MRMVLQAKDLWEVVSGEEVKAEAEKAGQAWERKARKALATIALALSAGDIIDSTTLMAAWYILEKLYEGKGWNHKFLLLQELFRMSMEGEKMDLYLHAMREKMSELSTVGLKLEESGRYQIGYHSQRFTGAISVPGCQFEEVGENRF